LSQITGLLTQAHYKTSPNDFRLLLDGSNIQLYTLRSNDSAAAIIGTALVAIEGKLPAPLCRQIWQGERRIKGHLLAQTLSCHGGFSDAPAYRYARVIRIAIHPERQHQGLGSQLLQQLEKQLQQQGCDFIGSSFGASTRLLRFWQQNQMTVVRLGISKEATSNEYSAIVLKALTPSGNHLLHQMQHKFDSELPQLLSEFYPLMPAGLTIQLLQQQSPAQLKPLDQQQQNDLDGFTRHHRKYEFCSQALFHYSLQAIAAGKTRALNPQQQQLLIAKVIRRQSWALVCENLKYSGKKAATAALKQVFELLTR
jgi:tRNA(Met) cytidine acetyltransferase